MSSQGQTPSKVLHVRNLAEGATRQELTALCSPFGTVSNVLVNVGPNRNQAFVEFEDLNSAIAIVEHFKTSGQSALVRGRACYLQYSNRQSIVNNPRDNPSRVILVALENPLARSITVETFQALFSTFGFVLKIATFEKGKGLQALVQFDEVESAQAAINGLDGRPIPPYLVPALAHVSLTMRISFSAHNDITVKFQGQRSRDFTNPHLPVAQHAADFPQAMYPLMQQSYPAPHFHHHNHHHEGGSVLICAVDNAVYPVTVDPLHTVFSKYGKVDKIAIFEKNGTPQALIQYADVVSANTAKAALEGHAIFEGGFNKLRISTSSHADLTIRANSERSWDYTGGVTPAGKGGLVEEPQRTRDGETHYTGIDFEQAHEAVSKAVQQAIVGGAQLAHQSAIQGSTGMMTRIGGGNGMAGSGGMAGGGLGGVLQHQTQREILGLQPPIMMLQPQHAQGRLMMGQGMGMMGGASDQQAEAGGGLALGRQYGMDFHSPQQGGIGGSFMQSGVGGMPSSHMY